MTSIPTAEDYQALRDEIAEMRSLMELIANSVGAAKIVRIMDIARMEGVSRAQISGREAYLLPNFGVSEFPDGTKRWNIETYMKWRKIPVDQRKRMFSKWLDENRKREVQSL